MTRLARAVRLVSIGWLLFLPGPLSYTPAAASVRRPETRLGHLGGLWYHLYAIF